MSLWWDETGCRSSLDAPTNPVASQQPAPIPEDLKETYEALREAPRFISLGGNIAVGLIERLGRVEEALFDLRNFMWSEGYADQTAVMRQADAALGTPGSTK